MLIKHLGYRRRQRLPVRARHLYHGRTKIARVIAQGPGAFKFWQSFSARCTSCDSLARQGFCAPRATDDIVLDEIALAPRTEHYACGRVGKIDFAAITARRQQQIAKWRSGALQEHPGAAETASQARMGKIAARIVRQIARHTRDSRRLKISKFLFLLYNPHILERYPKDSAEIAHKKLCN